MDVTECDPSQLCQYSFCFQKAVAKLAEEGLKAEVEQLDITHQLSRQMFVETIKSKYGQVECLVNNAGKTIPGSVSLKAAGNQRGLH